MGLLDQLAISTLPLLPTPLMRVLASRYIAGETLAQAREELLGLAQRGYSGIVDLLGEDVEDERSARVVADTYLAVANEVAQHGLDAYVSIKPTHLGLRLSEELAFELYERIAQHVGRLGNTLRVEMEDHSTTDATLRIFERLRERHDNVGIVLQSRLFRTPADIDALAPGSLSVRVVKGIYLEPARIAHIDPEPIRQAYLAVTRQLLERGAYVSLATHDSALAERLFEMIRELEIPRERYEMQVLLGVQEHLWRSWSAAGHPVRVYVPYGPEWRAYSTRRLRKNPQIFRHVVRDFFRRRRR